jgi:hypothetical protein
MITSPTASNAGFPGYFFSSQTGSYPQCATSLKLGFLFLELREELETTLKCL